MQKKPRLRPLQREDAEYLKRHGLRALVASAPGTGKTATSIRAVVEVHRHSLPCAVVCPATVTKNWAKEIKMWAPAVKVYIIEDGTSRIPKQGKNAFYILSWALLETRMQTLLRLGVRTVIADEAHLSKNPEALRTQALYKLSRQVPYLLLLTGTPIVNDTEEFRTLKALVGKKKLPMVRRLLEDVAPDIPPKRRSYLHVRLRPEDQVVYDKADDEFEEWLREEKEKLLGRGAAEAEVERILAAEALVKIGYLKRLSGEFKVNAAVDWIAKAVRVGEPVVVFLEHQTVLKNLTKALRKQRIRHAIIEGATPTKKRDALIEAFQKHEYPVFIGTKAAKEGITLTAARHLLFVERFYTSADEEQAEDRIRRIGQTRATTIWYLHAIDTVDDRIDEIVRTKRLLISETIGSETIQETPENNTENLLRMWDHFAGKKPERVLNLGQGDPPEPLPRPRECHAVIFTGKRWDLRSANAWCRMHGFHLNKLVPLHGRLKATIHPAEVFRTGTFQTYTVCKDVKLITGHRVKGHRERKIRRGLQARRKV